MGDNNPSFGNMPRVPAAVSDANAEPSRWQNGKIQIFRGSDGNYYATKTKKTITDMRGIAFIETHQRCRYRNMLVTEIGTIKIDKILGRQMYESGELSEIRAMPIRSTLRRARRLGEGNIR